MESIKLVLAIDTTLLSWIHVSHDLMPKTVDFASKCHWFYSQSPCVFSRILLVLNHPAISLVCNPLRFMFICREDAPMQHRQVTRRQCVRTICGPSVYQTRRVSMLQECSIGELHSSILSPQGPSALRQNPAIKKLNIQGY